MNQHTLRAYDDQLGQLTSSIIEMGANVRDLILLAKRAVTERDEALVEAARAKDKQINALDRQIEQQATVILALQNPMAVDLRYVTSSLRISIALERVGDLAKNITKRSAKLGEYKLPEATLNKLYQMVDIVVAMLEGALDAIKTRNADEALDVWKRDDEVDDLYHHILTTMQKEMQAHPDNILSCTHLVFVAKNFERIADYATNLAKTVHYVISGSPANKATMLPAKHKHNRRADDPK